MKIKLFLKNLENGQVLPIVVFAMLALISMAALLLDGGALMANRRTAQAAADAGALAGAKFLCEGKTLQQAEAEAEKYARMNLPNPDEDFVDPKALGTEVTVNTMVSHPSFFARIFGQDTLSATAKAVATCTTPSIAINTLPIAFFHNSPSVENAKTTDCEEVGACQLVTYDLFELLDTLSTTPGEELPLDYIYIVSNKTRICYEYPVDTFVCEDQAAASTSQGNRTWVDLEPLSTGNNIGQVITEGLDSPLSVNPPIWVNSKQGAVTAGYKAIYNLDPIPGYETLGVRLSYIPLYDNYCPKNTKSDCADPGDVYMYDLNGKEVFKDNSAAYRLTGFGGFLITCVTDANSCDPDGMCVNSVCPGYALSNPEPGDSNALEGYFVDGFDPDLFGLDGSEGGIYIVTLRE